MCGANRTVSVFHRDVFIDQLIHVLLRYNRASNMRNYSKYKPTFKANCLRHIKDKRAICGRITNTNRFVHTETIHVYSVEQKEGKARTLKYKIAVISTPGWVIEWVLRSCSAHLWLCRDGSVQRDGEIEITILIEILMIAKKIRLKYIMFL